MFPRSQRLDKKDAKFTAKRGRTVSGRFLRLKITAASGTGSRAAVVAGLAFDKKATARNRIKRQLREIVRPWLPQLKSSVNLMVFVSPRAKGLSFNVLRQEMQELLQRTSLL